MKIKRADTIVVQIFVAGRREHIDRVCQAYCDEVGLCVSIEDTTFIYTGGKEQGVAVRLVNYPRFPSTELQLHMTADILVKRLFENNIMESALVVGPNSTVWFSRRNDDTDN